MINRIIQEFQHYGDFTTEHWGILDWLLVNGGINILKLTHYSMLLKHTLVSLCLAAMHLILSSNKNFADSKGTLLAVLLDNGRWIVICKHLQSSLSPVTSISCKNPTNFATPQPSLFVSGSTKINCKTSITRKRLIFCPSFHTTVHAIRSELSEKAICFISCWRLC